MVQGAPPAASQRLAQGKCGEWNHCPLRASTSQSTSLRRLRTWNGDRARHLIVEGLEGREGREGALSELMIRRALAAHVRRRWWRREADGSKSVARGELSPLWIDEWRPWGITRSGRERKERMRGKGKEGEEEKGMKGAMTACCLYLYFVIIVLC